MNLRNRWIGKKTMMPAVEWGVLLLCAIGSAQEPNQWYSIVNPQPHFEFVQSDPEIPERLYSYSRGFFLSTDDGKHWVSSTNGIPPEYIRDMKDYGEDVFYRVGAASTDLYYTLTLFHPDPGGYDGYEARHLFKSTDAGASWTELWPLYYLFSTVKMDPISGVMIAGMRDFTYQSGRPTIQKSTDEGWSWCPVLTSGVFATSCIEFAPQGDGVVYVGVWYGILGTIFKSTDLGDSWTKVDPASGWNTLHVRQIEVHPADSDIVVALLASDDPIRRTLDGGATWTSITPPDILENGEPCNFFIAPDPPYSIFVFANGCRSIQKSDDMGDTWQTVSQNMHASICGTSITGCTPFNQSIRIPGHYYFAHGPIHSTTDGGLSWRLQTEDFYLDTRASQTLSTGNPDNLINLIGSNGAMWSSNGGANWLPSDGIDDVIFGAPFNTVINPNLPASIWNFTRSSYDCSDRFVSIVRESTDSGASWRTSDAFEDVRVVWMRASLHTPDRMFALVDTQFDINTMGGTFIRMSDDGFQTFREIHLEQTDCLWDITDLPDAPDSLIVLGSSPANAQCRGGVLRSSDEGDTWRETGPDAGFDAPRPFDHAPLTAEYGFLRIDPSAPNRLYVGFGSVFVSEDSGATFTRFPVEQYLIDDGKGAFQIDPSDPDVLYCALKNESQESSVIRTCDRGGIWSDPLYPKYLQLCNDGRTLIDQSGRRRMDIDSSPPRLMMAGYIPTESGVVAAFYAAEPDLNDQVTGIHAYFENERLPVTIETETEPGSGLFWMDLGAVSGTPGNIRIEYRAKDRFGMVSELWPRLIVH